MRVLLFGRNGHLGSELVARAPEDVDLVALSRADADLLDPRVPGRLIDAVRPDWVVNAAAWANVDAAERERDAAYAVNADAVRRLGDACAARGGTRLLHFSTDYVFPGSARDYVEDDRVGPLNWYGVTKAEGERLLRAAHPAAAVARVQWLFSARRPCFVQLMWERAKAGLRTTAVSDQIGRPSHVAHVARASWQLVRAGAQGTFHVTSEGPPASRFELAHLIFAACGAAHLVTPCMSADLPAAAPRPTRCVLANDRLRSKVGASLPDWRDAIAQFLAEARHERDASGIVEARNRARKPRPEPR